MKTSLCLIGIILIYLFVIKGVNVKTLQTKAKLLLTKAKALLIKPIEIVLDDFEIVLKIIAVFLIGLVIFLIGDLLTDQCTTTPLHQMPHHNHEPCCQIIYAS